MIELRNITKSYTTPKGRHYVFKNLSVILPENKSVGLLGRNGAGKSTLLRIIGGIDYPDSGEVITSKTISWPVALAGGFQGSLTARQNIRFVARLYAPESDVPKVVSFVEEFAQLGKYFDMPINKYSSGMRSRLGFGLSMAFDFDYYLLDEVGAVGDASFRKRSQVLLDDLKANSNIILVSHNPTDLVKNCDVGFVVQDGQALYFDDINEAIEVHREYTLKKK